MILDAFQILKKGYMFNISLVTVCIDEVTQLLILSDNILDLERLLDEHM
ncbi:MAG: hypothetical protein RL368_857 [Pseudomonadota bacterium]|jgi:hypothetical protein